MPVPSHHQAGPCRMEYESQAQRSLREELLKLISQTFSKRCGANGSLPSKYARNGWAKRLKMRISQRLSPSLFALFSDPCSQGFQPCVVGFLGARPRPESAEPLRHQRGVDDQATAAPHSFSVGSQPEKNSRSRSNWAPKPRFLRITDPIVSSFLVYIICLPYLVATMLLQCIRVPAW
jgi:hypothetical protein